MSPKVDVIQTAVVITPCAEEPALRAALIAAANDAGYAWRDEATFFAEPNFLTESRVLLICSDASWLNDLKFTRVIVIYGQPGTAMWSPAALQSADGRDGLIRVARSLAMASDFVRRTPSARVVHWNDLAPDRGAAFDALVETLKLPLKTPARKRLAQDFQLSLDSGPPARQRLQFRSIAEPALALYREGPLQSGAKAWWERGLFWSRYADHVCPEVIDITGRGQVLFYGPYFVLPAGRWRATAKFSLSDDAARRPYALDFLVDEQIMAVTSIWPSADGDYEIDVECYFPQAGTVQVRMYLAAPALHGEFRLKGVAIECLSLARGGPDGVDIPVS